MATKLEMCSRGRSRAAGQSCTGPPGTWQEQALGHQAEESQQGDGVEQQGEGVEQQGEGLEKQAGFVLGYQAGDVQQGDGVEQQAGVVLGHQAGVVQQRDGVEL